ncbi:hypothetical protein [Porphyromonas sp. COT-290 OH860]|uniref:hypothetical protein n=1 Tax=Porphyromonas sp. COT-290 OH860 TaxID=1515615 RepID=UPI00052D279C|nr:hypothetical protein [Porphyromonas sp. COT-290 OH860]KGN84466.1 hypothetical protein HQ41_04525 [Porphyromonas sp. COT-290 OH860]
MNKELHQGMSRYASLAQALLITSLLLCSGGLDLNAQISMSRLQPTSSLRAMEDPIAEGPIVLDHDEAYKCPVQGASDQGRYIFGYSFDSSFIYDRESKQYTIPSTGTRVIYVWDSGDAVVFVNQNSGGILPKGSTQVKSFTSPKADYPYVGPIYATSNTQYIIANLSNGGYHVLPAIISRSDAGTYVVEELPAPKEDLLGGEAQYTQARFCAEDGSIVYGVQVDWHGMFHRLVRWVRDSEGNYHFEGMLDDLFFNLQAPKPGPKPQEKDYITVPDTDPKYQEQLQAYHKAAQEWAKKVLARTKTVSFFSKKLQFSSDGNFICGAVRQAEDDETYTKEYPLLYDLRKSEAQIIRDMEGYCAVDVWGGQHLFCFTGAPPIGGSSVWSLATKKPQAFLKWLSARCGRDLKKDFTYESIDDLTGEKKEVTLPGYPTRSRGGLVITFFGLGQSEEHNARNSYLVFKKPFGTFIEEVQPREANLFGGYQASTRALYTSASGCQISVYDTQGILCFQGESNTEGVCLLPQSLTQGAYIITLVHPNKGNTSVKLHIDK